jgi:hypothetical protein
MKHDNYNHYLVMAIIMLFAGLLSTMNVWANSVSDIRLSLNDFYMIFLMIGWMLLFMSVYNKDYKVSVISVVIVSFSLFAIRKQLFINERQFLLGMIPHHSMAVHMSKKIKNENNDIKELLDNIIESQNKEIEFMKNRLNYI